MRIASSVAFDHLIGSNRSGVPAGQIGNDRVRLEGVHVRKSRWKAVSPLEPDAVYLVFASSIPPKIIRSTIELFRGSRSARRQLLGTGSVMGFALLAEPLRRCFVTLSMWRDVHALESFGCPHPMTG